MHGRQPHEGFAFVLASLEILPRRSGGFIDGILGINFLVHWTEIAGVSRLEVSGSTLT